ncbi:MAG TPA: helix-turn-helix domain-containing protein [Solirubrobacteraceae bacterium]|nr:helix-turn-helix domain-containing protein [Solirubrobacteraceae bacterium]
MPFGHVQPSGSAGESTLCAAPPRLLDELRAVHGAMVAAVVAGAGLARVAELAAEAAGAPVAVVVPGLAAAIAAGESHVTTEVSALEHWVAKRARGRPAVAPREVITAVPIEFLDEVAGLVVLLRSEHAQQAPRSEASEFLHAAAAAALMALAIESAKENVEQRLRGSLFEDLRSGRHSSGAEVARRAARLGCDLSGGAAILCAEGAMPQRIVAMIAAEHPGALAQQLDDTPDGPPRVYAALPATETASRQATHASVQRLAARLRSQATVGVSSFHADPAELGAAMQEAELMLEVLGHGEVDAAQAIGGRTYKLLFRLLASHPEEVRSFYESTIAPVARHEAQHGTELLHTVEAYLEANCNMSATAAAIFAHRHTVAYRLERVHELTGLDPMVSEERERLALGIKIHRIIAPHAD